MAATTATIAAWSPAPTTPPPSTAATATAGPTASLTADEQAAIDVFERFLIRAAEARSERPSSESLEFASYAAPVAASDLAALVQSELDEGIYWEGETDVLPGETRITADAVIVSGCMTTNWRKFRRRDSEQLLIEGPKTFRIRARVEWFSTGWRVAAVDVEEVQCSIE